VIRKVSPPAEASLEERGSNSNGVRIELGKIKPDILLAQEFTDRQAFGKLVTIVPEMQVHTFSRFLEPGGDKPSLQQVTIASRLEAHPAPMVSNPCRRASWISRSYYQITIRQRSFWI
jgi:hypothetical protein